MVHFVKFAQKGCVLPSSSLRFMHYHNVTRRSRQLSRRKPRLPPAASRRRRNMDNIKRDLKYALKRLNCVMEIDHTTDLIVSSYPALSQLLENCSERCQVKASAIPQAGKGLFAARDLEQGSVISFYPAHLLGMENSILRDDDNNNNHRNTLLSAYSSEDDKTYFEQVGESPFGQNSLHILNQEGFPVGAAEFIMDINPYQSTQKAWQSQFVNDGATIVDAKSTTASDDEYILQYYQQTNIKRNCFHIPFGPPPLLATVATRDIKQGEELYTSYDLLYWVSKSSSNEFLITEAIGQEAEALDDELWRFTSTINLSERHKETIDDVQKFFNQIQP